MDSCYRILFRQEKETKGNQEVIDPDQDSGEAGRYYGSLKSGKWTFLAWNKLTPLYSMESRTS